MSLVSMKVNGEAVCHEVPARMHLGDYLRDEARLTGTHLAASTVFAARAPCWSTAGQ